MKYLQFICLVISLFSLACSSSPRFTSGIDSKSFGKSSENNVAEKNKNNDTESSDSEAGNKTESSNGEVLGIASFYGKEFDGKQTANGEIFDMNDLTAAHPSLPFNTMVRVVNLLNNKSVEVRINDRKPNFNGRIIDLSYAAAKEIDLLSTGITKVKLTIIK